MVSQRIGMTPALALNDGHIGRFRDPGVDHDDAAVDISSGTPHEIFIPAFLRIDPPRPGPASGRSLTLADTSCYLKDVTIGTGASEGLRSFSLTRGRAPLLALVKKPRLSPFVQVMVHA